MVFLARLVTKIKWLLLPGWSREEKEEGREFGELLNEMFSFPQRTKEEEIAFEATLRDRYLRELSVPLLKSEAMRVTNDEQWEKAILSLRALPVRFRIKLMENSHITPWQSVLEQGVYESYFIFPSQGRVAYEEMEWLELNASSLSEKEQVHLSKFMYETRISQCHVLPLSMQIWQLHSYMKRLDPDEIDVVAHE